MTVPRAAATAIALGFLASSLGWSGRANAQEIPQPVELPQQLSMEQSVQILRSKSLDLLIAEASVHSAEGDVGVAGAVPNPAVNAGYGRALGYDPTQPGQSADQWTVGLSDQAAIEDSLSGKRDLRLRV